MPTPCRAAANTPASPTPTAPALPAPRRTRLRQTSTVLAIWFVAVPFAHALDSACEPGLKAAESRLSQAAWHSVSQLPGGLSMEVIKHQGQFYNKLDGPWSAMDSDVDAAERTMITQIRAGKIRMSQCRAVGTDTVDGIPVQVLAYRIEMPGAPAADTQLFIGKADGLPYRQLGGQTTVRYRYQGINAPK